MRLSGALLVVLNFSSKPVDGIGHTVAGECIAGVDAPASVVNVVQPKSLRAARAVDCPFQVLLVGQEQDRNRFEIFVRHHQRQFLLDDSQTQLVRTVQHEDDPVASLVESFPRRALFACQDCTEYTIHSLYVAAKSLGLTPSCYITTFYLIFLKLTLL